MHALTSYDSKLKHGGKLVAKCYNKQKKNTSFLQHFIKNVFTGLVNQASFNFSDSLLSSSILKGEEVF